MHVYVISKGHLDCTNSVELSLVLSLDIFRMPELPEISVEDQLQIANFLIVGLQQQVVRYEHAVVQYDQRVKVLLEIKDIQKQSIEFLENMLARVEGVFQPQIEKQKELNAQLKKELEEVKACLHRKNL